MSSLSIVLHPHEKKDGTHAIVFRLTIDRLSKYENSGYAVKENQFVGGLNGWVRKHEDAKLINRNLEIRRSEIMQRLMDAEAGLLSIDHKTIFKGEKEVGISFSKLLTEKADYYEKKGSKRSFRRCLQMKDEIESCFEKKIALSEMTIENVRKLELWLREKNEANTIKKKFSRLAGLVNEQKNLGKYAGINAFKLVKIQGTDIVKEKLTWEEIGCIENLKLSGMTEKVRDLFLFSFYAHGMRFGDCILFKKSDAKKVIYYKTQKNEKHISLVINKRLSEIIEKYLKKDSENVYLFNLVKKEFTTKWEFEDEKSSLNANVNNYLKRIAILAGIEKHISFHIARHSFAQLLKEYQSKTGKSDIYVIQQALGHSDIKTTQAYLSSLDNEKVNESVNEMFDR